MISSNVICSRHDIAEKSVHLFGIQQQSLTYHKTMKWQKIHEENSCLFEKINFKKIKKRRKVDGNLAPNLNHAINKRKKKRGGIMSL